MAAIRTPAAPRWSGATARQPLVAASGEDEPAVAAGSRALSGEGSPVLAAATVAQGSAPSAASPPAAWGVGLSPSRTPAAPRPETWLCDVGAVPNRRLGPRRTGGVSATG
ncbi:hypothetical protein Sgou_37970 [Streptomyces gougerotii]|uniref:Uncharacterized protein n=2 Tax=Streptomyces diastaticus group TaxID=2849069 RepID=A0A8H9HC43_9ACTN|nr:hypothetical protein Srut_50070 [Streptomyces rutgersensis]GFH73702.1 hypothetical protein Sdia_44700 [Streptomyces diastaticus subsp. diastaticus]GFH79127.1 hypothetical protein Sgou_37970 [Streptomyces gougerotii]GGU07813.1 hypothetical protein GCM10015534_07280 [Streptomyces diastaticus subsp. diastaticus]GGU55675.1 hypothetical protein GCM10010227_06220 [Streptomyces gougerotii]